MGSQIRCFCRKTNTLKLAVENLNSLDTEERKGKNHKHKIFGKGGCLHWQFHNRGQITIRVM